MEVGTAVLFVRYQYSIYWSLKWISCIIHAKWKNLPLIMSGMSYKSSVGLSFSSIKICRQLSTKLSTDLKWDLPILNDKCIAISMGYSSGVVKQHKIQSSVHSLALPIFLTSQTTWWVSSLTLVQLNLNQVVFFNFYIVFLLDCY